MTTGLLQRYTTLSLVHLFHYYMIYVATSCEHLYFPNAVDESPVDVIRHVMRYDKLVTTRNYIELLARLLYCTHIPHTRY